MLDREGPVAEALLVHQWLVELTDGSPQSLDGLVRCARRGGHDVPEVEELHSRLIETSEHEQQRVIGQAHALIALGRLAEASAVIGEAASRFGSWSELDAVRGYLTTQTQMRADWSLASSAELPPLPPDER